MDDNPKYEKAKQLAKISKRLDELKERLEGGQLKVDDIADSGVEYKILKKVYEELLYSKDMAGSLGKGDALQSVTVISAFGGESPNSTKENTQEDENAKTKGEKEIKVDDEKSDE